MSKSVFRRTYRTVLLLGIFASFLACSGSEMPERRSTFTLVENPSGRVPLAAAVYIDEAPGFKIDLAVTDGIHSWSASFGEEVYADGRYTVPVVGMRADREHTIDVKAHKKGTELSQRFTHRTPSMSADPRETPPFDIQIAEADKMEPGVLFLSVRRRALGRPHWLSEKQRKFSTDWGRVYTLDPSGEVIWFFESDQRLAGIDRLHNGNILMHRTDYSTLEVDLLGNIVRQFYAGERPHPKPENDVAIPIKGQQTLHHQPHQLPNGNMLAFSANGYKFENWYTSETDASAPRADQMVMADTIVEITPEGDTVWSWNTLDYLDKERIGYDTFWSYWWVRQFPQHMDWTHANGLSWDENDDSILVSLRNQSAILKVDYETKDIKWILGRHDGWKGALAEKLLEPEGPLLWQGYQHNPRVTHAGTVILFDNRAHSAAMPPQEPLPLEQNFSRAVEYQVDEENMTVRQVWTSGDEQGDDPCFTNAMSDAWRLPITDNRLVIHAFCTPLLEGLSHDSMDPTRRYTSDLPSGPRILEYTENNEVVFRADIHDKDDLMQWETYGGFKSPDIYHTQGTAH